MDTSPKDTPLTINISHAVAHRDTLLAIATFITSRGIKDPDEYEIIRQIIIFHRKRFGEVPFSYDEHNEIGAQCIEDRTERYSEVCKRQGWDRVNDVVGNEYVSSPDDDDDRTVVETMINLRHRYGCIKQGIAGKAWIAYGKKIINDYLDMRAPDVSSTNDRVLSAKKVDDLYRRILIEIYVAADGVTSNQAHRLDLMPSAVEHFPRIVSMGDMCADICNSIDIRKESEQTASVKECVHLISKWLRAYVYRLLDIEITAAYEKYIVHGEISSTWDDINGALYSWGAGNDLKLAIFECCGNYHVSSILDKDEDGKIVYRCLAPTDIRGIYTPHPASSPFSTREARTCGSRYRPSWSVRDDGSAGMTNTKDSAIELAKYWIANSPRCMLFNKV